VSSHYTSESELPSVVGAGIGGMLVIMTRTKKSGEKAKENKGKCKELVVFYKYVD
jgi:hypothetical protein